MMETELHGCSCTECGYKFDLASGVGQAENSAPEPGGISLCIRCGNADVFDEVDGVLTLRVPTPEELESINADLTVRAAQIAIRGMRTWSRK
jgi:hypothetical protein